MGYWDVWSHLSSNDFVSRLALQNGIDVGAFPSVGASLTTGDFVTKGQAPSYASVNSIGGTSTDFVTKSQLVSTVNAYYSDYLYYTSYSGGSVVGYSTSGASCSNGVSVIYNFGVFATSTTLTVGMTLYSTSTGGGFAGTPYSGSWFFIEGANCAVQLTRNSNGSFLITSLVSCSTPSTYNVSYSITNSNAALYVQAYIYHNGSLAVQTTGSPAYGLLGSFTITPGDDIEVQLIVFGVVPYTQSVSVYGGAYFADSGYNYSIDSGTLSPGGDTYISIELAG